MNRRFNLTGIADEGCAGLDQQVQCHAELGWAHLELRSIGNVPLGNLPDQDRAMACATLNEQSVQVVALASQIGNWGSRIDADSQSDVLELRRLIDMAGRLDCRMIRVMSYPNCGWSQARWRQAVIERFKRLVAVAEPAGVVLIHENCAGWAGQGAEQSLDLLDSVGSQHLKLLFDVGNGLSYGYEALEVLEQVLPHVLHVHLKDGRRQGDQVHYSYPGAGEVQARQCIELLFAHGYAGWFSIEPHLCLIPHLQQQAADPRQQRAIYQDYARHAQALLKSCQEYAHAVHP